MKLSEVKKKLLAALLSLENENGYKINKGKFALIKKNIDGSAGLYFTENNWIDEIQIMPAICVDVDEINLIWKKFNDHISYTYFMNLLELKDWYELGKVDRIKFKVEEHDRFKLFNEEQDLISASEHIKNLFKTYGLRYVNDFSTVNGVDKLYNSNLPEISKLHCSGIQVQSVVGLIAAKLSGNPNYNTISDIYSSIIEKHKIEDTMNMKDIEVFFKVKEYLG